VQRSLREVLLELHQERERRWPAEDLKVNVDQRAELVASFDPSKAVAAGDTLDDFRLEEVDEGALSLSQLVRSGPAVLIFFRYAGCPVCNLTLPYYDRHLLPALQERGIPLVAVSPQMPERLREIKTRHGLKMKVATDRNNDIARRLGITFICNDASKEFYLAQGWSFPVGMGTGTWELPHPTALVVDRNRRVLLADVTPDWLLRTEPATILSALADEH